MAQAITSCPVVRGNIQYKNTSGSICQLVVQFNYFYYTSSTLTVNFSVGINSQGSSTGGGESHNKSIRIFINGIEVTNPSGQDIFNTTTTFAYTGQLTTLRVIASASGTVFIAAGPSRTEDVNSSFDDTFNITPINSTTDFVFTDLTQPTTALGGKFFQLPSAASYANKMLFIKAKSAIPNNDLSGGQFRAQCIYLNTINGELIKDFNSVGVCMNNNYACLTLFSDGTSWIITNYYPSNNQSILPTIAPPTDRSSLSAFSNRIAFYSTDVYGRTGQNLIRLEQPINGLPGMTTVIYYGSNANSRDTNNALAFQTYNGLTNPVDGITAGLPYISCDNAQKSTGIVFITDGVNWYIAGWAPTSGWNWNDSTNGSMFINASYSDRDLINIQPNANGYYRVPTLIPNSQYMLVCKSTTVGSNPGLRYATKDAGNSSSLNTFNTDSKSIYWTQNTTNTCVWFVTYNNNPLNIGNISNISYFPIMLYTP